MSIAGVAPKLTSKLHATDAVAACVEEALPERSSHTVSPTQPEERERPSTCSLEGVTTAEKDETWAQDENALGWVRDFAAAWRGRAASEGPGTSGSLAEEVSLPWLSASSSSASPGKARGRSQDDRDDLRTSRIRSHWQS